MPKICEELSELLPSFPLTYVVNAIRLQAAVTVSCGAFFEAVGTLFISSVISQTSALARYARIF